MPGKTFEEVLKKWISQEDSLECLYVVNMEGTLVTHKIFNENVVLRKSPLFKPAWYALLL